MTRTALRHAVDVATEHELAAFRVYDDAQRRLMDATKAVLAAQDVTTAALKAWREAERESLKESA